jgi:hypothetical protein
LVILREPIGILPPPFNPSLPIKFKYSLLLALFLIFSPILFDTLISRFEFIFAQTLFARRKKNKPKRKIS